MGARTILVTGHAHVVLGSPAPAFLFFLPQALHVARSGNIRTRQQRPTPGGGSGLTSRARASMDRRRVNPTAAAVNGAAGSRPTSAASRPYRTGALDRSERRGQEQRHGKRQAGEAWPGVPAGQTCSVVTVSPLPAWWVGCDVDWIGYVVNLHEHSPAMHGLD
jgi:hypothetical protein